MSAGSIDRRFPGFPFDPEVRNGCRSACKWPPNPQQGLRNVKRCEIELLAGSKERVTKFSRRFRMQIDGARVMGDKNEGLGLN